MTTPAQGTVYCSDLSLQAGEPLFGSATQTQAYLLLEYNGAWGEKAVEQSELPAAVKARLSDLGKQVRQMKTLLIKMPGRPRLNTGIRFFVASMSQHPHRLYAFRLADYGELLKLDILAILAGDSIYDSYRRELPLYLVCANGRRDQCCARHGPPVYDAMLKAAGASPEPLVWESSHVGGHRFAANLTCLPSGVLYGRVRPESALAILDADRNGRIYLPNLRGRVNLPPAAQAAEYYLRQQSGEDRLDMYRLMDMQEISPGEWEVRFDAFPLVETMSVRVRVGKTDRMVFDSCALDKSTAAVDYEFLLAES